MSQPRSILGSQLLALLPDVYRSRDEGDLAGYLDACGELLDQLRLTTDQLLADAFPDLRPGDRGAQDWILPYLAQLLDVNLLSPHVEGRRSEVANAVAWRQRKGTQRAARQISEAVARAKVEIREGWRRVAVTPRVDIPIQTAAVFGLPEPDADDPSAAARHPGLPAVTPDVTRPSRALGAELGEAGVFETRFEDTSSYWRQLNHHGAPCFPDSYEDFSRRTPDLRTPDWRHGHAHPRRALCFVPPPPGFFPLKMVALKWSDRHAEVHKDHVTDVTENGRRRVYHPGIERGDPAAPSVTIRTHPAVFEDAEVTIEDLNFSGTVTVDGGVIELQRVAARRLVVRTLDVGKPVLRAQDCLFDEIEAPDGLVQLEYTSVMKSLRCRRLLASDSIFHGTVALGADMADRKASCVRFSRLPDALAEVLEAGQRPQSTTEQPVFFDFEYCDGAGVRQRSNAFGKLGYAVLHPLTPSVIQFGAEDGGEMGAYHHRHYALQAAAAVKKLENFLPVGIEAVLIPDPRLLAAPPEKTR